MICRIQRWKDLEFWISMSSQMDQIARSDYVPLDELLTIVRAPLDLKRNPIVNLNVIKKVSFGGILELRTDKEKVGYKGSLLLAKPGQLITSKINFIHGSFCIIPDSLGPIAVSSEYPTFDVDRKQILPEYLNLILRTDFFKNQLSTIRSGSAKKRVQANSVLSKVIPLPRLDVQFRVVTAYQDALRKAGQLETDAAQIEREAQQDFEAALGLKPPTYLPKRRFQIVRFKDIERWSHEGILQELFFGGSLPETNFDIIQLGEIATVSYGLQKCPANRPGKQARPYLRVANVQRGYLDLREIKMINVIDAEMPRYRLEDGDILLCEGNSADLVGRGAIWKSEITDCVHQNHVLRVRLDPQRAVPEFILAYINSTSGQAYFRLKAKRTTNLASINSREVANLLVPLPPNTETQMALVKGLNKAEENANLIREEAAAMRSSAWNEFTESIFG